MFVATEIILEWCRDITKDVFCRLPVNLTCHASEYKIHRLHQRYILARRVKLTVGDSGLCCCVCVTSFER